MKERAKTSETERRGLKRNMRKIKSKKEHEKEERDTKEGDEEEGKQREKVQLWGDERGGWWPG